MKLGIMQPYFFPYIGYFQLLNAVDEYVIYDDVNYIKGGWINRNRILINGNPVYINVELKDASPFKKINEIELTGNEKNKKKVLNSLEMSYRKAPYYNVVFPLIKEIILQEELNLAKYLIFSIKCICNYLDIDTKILISSEIQKNDDLKSSDKVIHICKLLGAEEYYNAIGGQELYDFNEFNSNNIKLNFLKTDNIVYQQNKNEFVSNLSIIDVLMFNSKDKVKEMLNKYTLISN